MKFLPLAVTTIIVFLLDQTTKILLANIFPFSVIPSFLTIAVTRNTGIAFSIPLQGLLLIIITIAIIILGIIYAVKHFDFSKIFTQIVCGMILGGAFGNLFDRILRGYVVDFIQVSLFPVFNVADMFISIGGILFIFFYSRIELKKK